MPSFQYIERLISKNVVEFYAKTLSGHRVIRIYLNHPTPRVLAITERAAKREPALIYLDELRDLLKRAREICFSENSNEATDSKSTDSKEVNR